MNSIRQLEQIYENHFVSPHVAIVKSTPDELLTAFEEAAQIDSAVYTVIEAVYTANSSNILISEAAVDLDRDSRTYAFAVEKLLRHYKEGNDEAFNKRFEVFLEASARDPKTGRFIRPTAAPAGATPPPVAPAGTAPAGATPPAAGEKKPGFWSKLGGWLGKAAQGVGSTLGKFGGGVVSGYQGARGATTPATGGQAPAATAKPINKSYTGDLSAYTSDKATSIAADKGAQDFGLSPEEEASLEKGAVLNVTDKAGNIIQYRYRNGLLSGLKVGGGSTPAPATPAPATPAPATPAPATPAPATPAPATPAPATPAPATPAPAAPAPAAPTNVTPEELAELQQNLATAGFSRTAEMNARASELANKPGVPPEAKAKWDQIKGSTGLKETKFDTAFYKVLKEFNRNSKKLSIE